MIPAVSDIVKDGQSAFSGGAPESLSQSRWAFNDFNSNLTAQADPFGITGGGTFVTAPTVSPPGTHGCVLFRSSTVANSGVRAATTQPVISTQGIIYRAIIAMPAAILATTTMYIGGHDTATQLQPVDGAYFKIIGATLNCETSTNSVRTTAAPTLTLTVNSVYVLDVEWISISSVRFVVSNLAGTNLYDQTISTNVPQLIARSFLWAVIATNSGTVASDLLLIDYAGFGPQRPSFIVTPA
jgi:hypothetical protein